MAQIGSDRRKTWTNGVPCEDAVRAFRARHRELTFRNAENKYYAKFKGEAYAHVTGIFDVLRKVEAAKYWTSQ